MISRILLKLADKAILPAVILLFARVAGVLLTVSFLDIPLADNSGIFGVYFTDPGDFLKVNSYSAFFMVCVVFAFSLFFFIKSRIFHETHVTPVFAAKLFSFRLGGFIKGTFDIYSEGVVWVLYSYLLTVMLGFESFSGVLNGFVFAYALCVSVFLTLVFVSDIDRELAR